jgi:hypothetical protein
MFPPCPPTLVEPNVAQVVGTIGADGIIAHETGKQDGDTLLSSLVEDFGFPVKSRWIGNRVMMACRQFPELVRETALT